MAENLMLTAAEANKLPFCRWSEFGKCDRKDADIKFCVACQTENILTSLRHEDLAGATMAAMVLTDVLKQAGVWPEKKA
jgi:hypothetical protein